jgi:predicted RNA-binding Zn ribbon-like protein
MDIDHLPLVGGHLALDLVNTLERGTPAPGTRPTDFLAAPRDLLVWAERTDLVTRAEGGTAAAAWSEGDRQGTRALERIRGLREAVHLAVLAQLGEIGWDDAGIRSALDLLGRRWADAIARSRLRPSAEGGPLVREVGTEPAHLIEDRLAEAAVTLLTGPESARVRRCPVEQGGCGWVFLDRSRNSSRTWCRMADCGNQVKAQRLTERRRQLRAAQASTEGR